MMKCRGLVRLIFATMLLVSPPVSAADAPKESWGKVGVTQEEYRKDSLECAVVAYLDKGLDTPAGKTLVEASSRIERILSEGDGIDAYVDASQTAAAVRPQEKLRQLEERQQGILDRCLSDRGYRKFRLTSTQRSRLRKLRNGSEARRAYLLSLATDPAVLERQTTK